MGGFSGGREPEMQQCIHCGKQIRRNAKQCPYCREAQAEGRPTTATRPRTQVGGHFRSGLLLMLLSAAVHYFAGGYSPLVLPSDISSPMLTYRAPVLFLVGLAMSLWSFFLRIQA
jgi:hypothetical protein